MHKITTWKLAVLIGTIGWVLIGCLTAWNRHTHLVTSQYDLGNMEQIVWQSLNGHWFSFVDPNLGTLQPRAAYHTDFLILASIPFYLVWPDPRTLLFLQVVIVGSGSVAMWLLARRRLSERWAAALSISYLLYPPLLWAVSFDVHAVVWTTPLFLWACVAAEWKHWKWFAVLTLAMILSKEEVGILVAMLGLWLMRHRTTRTAGFIALVGGLIATVLMLGVVIPGARQQPGHFAEGYFSDFGQTPGQIFTGSIVHPAKTIETFAQHGGVQYVWMLLWPLALLPLLGWEVVWMVIPFLGINILSTEPNLRSIYFHYTSTITPVLFLASLYAIQRLQRWLKAHLKLRRPVFMGVAILAVSGIFVWAPLPFTRHAADAYRPFQKNTYAADVQKARTYILPTDRVVTMNMFGPQFTSRQWLWLFPVHIDQADIAIVAPARRGDVTTDEKVQSVLQRLLHSANWHVLYQHQDFYVLRQTTGS